MVMSDDLIIYRSRIDLIDDRIATALKDRAMLTAEIQKYKQKNNIQKKDEKREEQIINRMTRATSEYISEELITNIYKLIFKETVK